MNFSTLGSILIICFYGFIKFFYGAKITIFIFLRKKNVEKDKKNDFSLQKSSKYIKIIINCKNQ